MNRIFIPLALIAAAPAPVSQLIVTAPTDLSAPAPEPIRIAGLQPGERATLIASRRGSKDTFSSSATFVADRQGRVDTARQAPVAGSYSGVDALGLYWSVTPRPTTPDDPPVGQTIVTVRADGRVASARPALRQPDADRYSVRRDTPFPGAVYARPAGGGRHPVIIVLGGSEGGASTAESMAPLFAANGYATLGLPYHNGFRDPPIAGLPDSFTDLPIDRLIAARDWLAQQPDADVDRLGVWGVSKGSEFALIAASTYPWIKAVVAVVPSDLVWEGWGRPGPKTASFAIDGKPLPFQPYDDIEREIAAMREGKPGDLARAHADGRTRYPDRVAAARIPIERYRGSLLLIAGEQDRTWPSAPMARNIAATRKRAGLGTELLVYPGAGHGLAGPGTDPANPPTARGRAIAWRATFAMFDRALALNATRN